MDRFCSTCEAIAATAKKLEKIFLVCNYLSSLGEDELAVALVFLSGRAFPLCDMKALNVGGSTIKEAVCMAGKVAQEEFVNASIRLGDDGDAAFELLRGKLRCASPG